MIQKVKRDTLSDQVIQGLIAFIDSRDLTPGDSLPSESQLAEEFGASRPVIREALKVLQGEGIIEIITGRNAVIKPVSSTILKKFFQRAVAFKSASFRDLIEVRRGLEMQSAMLAAERCTDDDLGRIQEVLLLMRESLTDHQRFAGYDVQFHLLIAATARNPMIYYLVESLRDAMRDNVLQGLKHRFSREDYRPVQARHEDIFQALTKRDSQQAMQAMQAHFEEALNAASADEKD
ncbi:MAG: FadR family transcriptional regulator [Anaerolineae bacterium]|jgi:DNA-binding FadR family transcriptional regulator|nr:FadR family transcriptional regulator [Anaerolineae bacterium]